ncbi:unnamed protein product [Calypogeia fissa]
MALLDCRMVSFRSFHITLLGHSSSLSNLYGSSSSRFFTNSRGCMGPTSFSNPPLLRKSRRRSDVCNPRAEGPDGGGNSPESVDISVFRFTLGIPGFDDSDLPRVLGILFGGLLIANHFSSLNSLTGAQLRSEAVGLVLAAVCVSLPFIGRQLNGANKIQRTLKPGQKQIFCLADGLTDTHRQDLAWVSYNLMRNTSTTAMLVWHSGQVVGARGFWGALADSGPGSALPLGSLQQKLEAKVEDFSTLKEPLYLSGNADLQGWEILPSGAASVLVQPFPKDSNSENDGAVQGFILLISRTPAGYRRKDRQWTASLAKKLSQVLCK